LPLQRGAFDAGRRRAATAISENRPRYSQPVAPTARLEVVAGKAAGMSILVDDELLIGRHADGAGRLAEDEEISRSHARLTMDRSGFCAIEDLGSTNGTFVNGLLIKGPQTLSEGDTVEVGGTTLVVRDLPTPRSGSSITPRPGSRTMGRIASPRDSQLTPTTVGPRPESDEEQETASRLSLQLDVDFDAREAQIAFLDGADPLRLVFRDGRWRPMS
jgi:predicted component of type VI protein secretion system